MRKITALFLLLVFLLNSTSFVNLYQLIHSKTSRMVRKAQSRHEELLTVTLNNHAGGFDAEGLEQIGLREYLYQGRRYDLINTEEKKGRTILHLIHDSYEEDFLDFLTSFFNSTSKRSNNRSNSIVHKSLSKRYLASQHTFPKIDGKAHNYSEAECIIPSSPYLEVLFPPPKMA